MDFKDFKDGLTSLSLILFIFLLTVVISIFFLKPFIKLLTKERDFLLIICSINLLFSLYYLWNALSLEKIFMLENKNIVKFGKKIGIVTILYTSQPIIFSSFYFRNIHNLLLLMISLIILIELALIVLVFKEVYDLVFLEESRRNFEIEANRSKYIEKEKRQILEE
jgi:hypothetical protein